MQRLVAAGLGLALGLGAMQQVWAQGFESVEAINRCEAFIEGALRPELGRDFKQVYKVTCYFGLVDPSVHQDHRAACARAAAAMAGASREIAEFTCVGTYQVYLDETGAE